MEKKNQMEQTISLVKRLNTYKIVISDYVERKIRYMCAKFPNNEWSGTLFYKSTGTFENDNLTIRCVDFFVMDIGSAAYTEFDMSPDVMSYMTENPELLDSNIHMGLIHSHDAMSTFFSGTDQNTLKEEGIDRNHFVSLIVNNAREYTAAITRKVHTVKEVKENYTYKTFDDKEAKGVRTTISEYDSLEWYNLDVEFEEDMAGLLDDRLKELREINKSKNFLIKKTKEPTLFDYDDDWGKPFWEKKYSNPKKNSIFRGGDAYCQEVIETPKSNYVKEKNYIPDVKHKEVGEVKPMESELDDIPYGNILFDPYIIKSLTLELITGSIVVQGNDKIDVNNWSKQMVRLFDDRFGNDENGMESFKEWAEGYIEFLCLNAYDKNIDALDYSGDEMAAICAYDLTMSLGELPSNKYIEEYIRILNDYIIM